jgi:hypothetical protein
MILQVQGGTCSQDGGAPLGNYYIDRNFTGYIGLYASRTIRGTIQLWGRDGVENLITRCLSEDRRRLSRIPRRVSR